MKLCVKSPIVLLSAFSVFTLFIISGCGTSETNTDTTVKLKTSEGIADGYQTKSSYTYDNQQLLTSIFTKTIAEDLGIEPNKAISENASDSSIEQKIKYDENGNITRIQVWIQFYDEEEIIFSYLENQSDYTYIDNKLAEYTLSRSNGPTGLSAYEKRQYGYNEDGDMDTIEIYYYDYTADAIEEEYSKVFSIEYDLNKNVTKVENKDMGDTPSGYTYIMTYNDDNQMVKHEAYSGVNLEINDNLSPGYTYILEYDNTANTVTLTNTIDPTSSTLFGFSGQDIGYLNMNMSFRIRVPLKAKAVGPMSSMGAILVPSKLARLLAISLNYNNFDEPSEILATQQLITERTNIYNGDTPSETTYFDSILDDDGYPETITFYDAIESGDLGINFTWN